MVSPTLSSGQMAVYILLPIISFTTIVIVVYYCYRRRKCCFSTKEEALLGNMNKNRFTVDMGKRKRRSSSMNSNSWDSFDHEYQRSFSRNQHINNNSEKGVSTIISIGTPRPDIKRSAVVGQAASRDTNLLSGAYHPQRRATSPAQSLPESGGKSPVDYNSISDLYTRHHSYEAAVSARRVNENFSYNTIIDKDIQENLRDTKATPNNSLVSENYTVVAHQGIPSPRRLRHQNRVKGKENEPSFSRPTNQPRVSLIISAVESLDFDSSDKSDLDTDTKGRKQLYSPSGGEIKRKKSTSNKDELQPERARKISASFDRDRKSPSTQYSGRSSPAILEAVNEEEAVFPAKSPTTRSRSSPVGTHQSSLDMNALYAALGQHRKSEGDVFGGRKNDDENPFHQEGLQRDRTRTESQSSTTGLPSAKSLGDHSPNSSTLSVNKETFPGRQGRRRSSMQMPIDLSQINPKLYEHTDKLPSMDSEEPDVESPQIHFTLDYNKDLEVLIVKLIQARNLESQDFSGTCDPYCTVTLLPGFNARQSKVHRRTTDPEFEEKFSFSVKLENMRFKTLEIRTYDFDQFSRDECTGIMQMKLDVIDFELTPHYDLWKKFEVQDLQTSELSETCGDLLLALSYLPSAEKLTVAIQKARNLNSPEGRKGPPDTYIKVSIFRGSQRLKKKKTDTVQATHNPVFNQALTFSVSPTLLQCPLVRITCQAVHDQKLSSNAELGFLEIGPSSKCEEELKHWRDVSGKHSNKPVARWHKLHAPEANNDDSKGSFLNLANVRRSSSSVLYPQSDKPESGRISPSVRRSLT
ncbi:uncharacterized protein LOC120344479 isoform X1 [Styela clava]